MIDNRGADRNAALDRGTGRCHDAGLLKRDRDLRVDPVSVRAAVAETDDVERHGRQELQLWRRLNATLQVLRELAAMRDRPADPLSTVNLEGEPCPERAEAAREVRTEITGPGGTRGKTARLASKIGGWRGE